MSAAPRMSPLRACAPAACALQWTLGKGGTLSIETVADGPAESAVLARCEIRSAGSSPVLTEIPLTLDGADRQEVRLSGEGGAFLHLLAREGGLLVLTNLPEVLGLRGGTYTLTRATGGPGR